MNVAVPLFGQDIAPRFGCSRSFMLATIEDGRVQRREVADVPNLQPWQLPDFLASLQVAKLICGGVHPRFQRELERRGIEVIWGVIGPAPEALQAIANGTLRADQFVCAGRRDPPGRRRRRRRAGSCGPRASPGGVSARRDNNFGRAGATEPKDDPP